MKKPAEIIENIVRYLAQAEVDRVRAERAKEEYITKARELLNMEELITGMIDDLDAAKYLERKIAEIESSVRIGGTD